MIPLTAVHGKQGTMKSITPTTTLLLWLALAFIAACGGGDPEELKIPVKVEQERLIPETVRIKQDDMVTLKIEADEAGQLHLHGYDVEKAISPGQVIDLYFVANATGRFRITFHSDEVGAGSEGEHKEGGEEEETTIGFVEVQPR